MKMRLIAVVLSGFLFPVAILHAGGLVLQFDDGDASWIEVAAPALQERGWVATGFVTDRSIKSGSIRIPDLLRLQNEFGWEIGTHTVSHLNAPRYAEKHGIERWVHDELLASITALESAGLNIQNMVFPFNAYTPQLAAAVTNHLRSFRRTDPVGLSTGRSPDGSLPARSIDIDRYTPVDQLLAAIDLAAEQDRDLCLYGHRIFADAAYFTSSIVTAGPGWVETTDAALLSTNGPPWVLIPDIRRAGLAMGVSSSQAHRIYFSEAPGKPVGVPGATVLVGPSYSTRLSDLLAILDHAGKKLSPRRVQDVAD